MADEVTAQKRGRGRPRKERTGVDVDKSDSAAVTVSEKGKKVEQKPYTTPRDEYVRSPQKIGLRELARRWDANFRQIADLCKKEQWVEQREQYQSQVQALTDSKVAELVSESDAEATARHIATLKSIQAITGAFLASDNRPFKDKDSAINILLNAIKEERRCRGLQAGDRPDDGGGEDRSYEYNELLRLFEEQKRKERGEASSEVVERSSGGTCSGGSSRAVIRYSDEVEKELEVAAPDTFGESPEEVDAKKSKEQLRAERHAEYLRKQIAEMQNHLARLEKESQEIAQVPADDSIYIPGLGGEDDDGDGGISAGYGTAGCGLIADGVDGVEESDKEDTDYDVEHVDDYDPFAEDD